MLCVIAGLMLLLRSQDHHPRLQLTDFGHKKSLDEPPAEQTVNLQEAFFRFDRRQSSAQKDSTIYRALGSAQLTGTLLGNTPEESFAFLTSPQSINPLMIKIGDVFMNATCVDIQEREIHLKQDNEILTLYLFGDEQEQSIPSVLHLEENITPHAQQTSHAQQTPTLPQPQLQQTPTLLQPQLQQKKKGQQAKGKLAKRQARRASHQMKRKKKNNEQQPDD
jgi:hypothetical protein